ncbi:MAG: cellulase N-terminal Ig-like domain-containing protein, partial [Ignavibacteriaceae bacterium]
MKNKFRVNHLSLQLVMIILVSNILVKGQDTGTTNYIRHNLIGYLTTDQKIAIVGAETNLAGKSFYLVEAGDPEKVVYTGVISNDRGRDRTPFSYNFPCDFTSFCNKGKYKIKLEDGTLSHQFVIGGENEYREALALVLQYFHSQRCGNTDP